MPSGAYGYDVSGVQLSNTTPDRESLALIAGAVQGQSGGSGGGGGLPVVIAPGTFTPYGFNVGNSASQAIPSNSMVASITFLGTGTCSIAFGATTLTYAVAGVLIINFAGKPAVTMTVNTDSGTTASILGSTT